MKIYRTPRYILDTVLVALLVVVGVLYTPAVEIQNGTLIGASQNVVMASQHEGGLLAQLGNVFSYTPLGFLYDTFGDLEFSFIKPITIVFSWLIEGILIPFITFLSAEAGTFMGEIADFLFNNGLQFTERLFDGGDDLGGATHTLWSFFRDIANILLGITLIISATAFMFGIGGGNPQKNIIYILSVAIFLNFSLFFVRFFVDISNFLSYSVYTQLLLSDGAAGDTVAKATNNKLKISRLVNPFLCLSEKNPEHCKEDTKAIGVTGEEAATGATTLLLGSVKRFSVGVMTFFLVTTFYLVLILISLYVFYRSFILAVMAILSPLALASYPVPQLKPIFHRWKSLTITNIILLPVFLLLLYISITLIQRMSVAIYQSSTGSFSGSFIVLGLFILTMYMLYSFAKEIKESLEEKSRDLKPVTAISQGINRIGSGAQRGAAHLTTWGRGRRERLDEKLYRIDRGERGREEVIDRYAGTVDRFSSPTTAVFAPIQSERTRARREERVVRGGKTREANLKELMGLLQKNDTTLNSNTSTDVPRGGPGDVTRRRTPPYDVGQGSGDEQSGAEGQGSTGGGQGGINRGQGSTGGRSSGVGGQSGAERQSNVGERQGSTGVQSGAGGQSGIGERVGGIGERASARVRNIRTT